MAFGKVASRVIDKGNDNMGRWSHMLLEAKDNHEPLIVSVHQSCKTTTNGNNTFHVQQQIMMSLQNRSDLDPRRNFHKDTAKFLTEKMAQHSATTVVVPGDWNETMQDKSTANKLATTFGLVDVWEHQNHEDDFATHSRGKRKIDLALAPPYFSNISTMSCEPFHSRLKGDH